MNKLYTLLLAFVLMCTLSACSEEETQPTNPLPEEPVQETVTINPGHGIYSNYLTDDLKAVLPEEFVKEHPLKEYPFPTVSDLYKEGRNLSINLTPFNEAMYVWFNEDGTTVFVGNWMALDDHTLVFYHDHNMHGVSYVYYEGLYIFAYTTLDEDGKALTQLNFWASKSSPFEEVSMSREDYPGMWCVYDKAAAFEEDGTLSYVYDTTDTKLEWDCPAPNILTLNGAEVTVHAASNGKVLTLYYHDADSMNDYWEPGMFDMWKLVN